MSISKAAHYRSFYESARKLKNPEARLAFYDALDAYRFDGVEPENLPFEADLLFTAIRSIVDADLARKNAGAPKGNQNAKKATKEDINIEENNSENNIDSTIETIQNNSENNIDLIIETIENNSKTNNDNDNVNVNENADAECMRVSDVESWCSSHNLTLASKDLRNLTTSLIIKKQPVEYLDYALDYVNKKSFKARDGTLCSFKDLPEANQRGMFITAVTTWQDMEQGYAAWHDEQEEKKASKPPSRCPVCHNPVERNSYGALCRHCSGYVIRQDGRWILEPWTTEKLKIVLPGNKSG